MTIINVWEENFANHNLSTNFTKVFSGEKFPTIWYHIGSTVNTILTDFYIQAYGKQGKSFIANRVKLIHLSARMHAHMFRVCQGGLASMTMYVLAITIIINQPQECCREPFLTCDQ